MSKNILVDVDIIVISSMGRARVQRNRNGMNQVVKIPNWLNISDDSLLLCAID